jgi:hypothetical protein
MRQVHRFPDGTQLEWSPTGAGYPGHWLDVSCPCGPWCLTDAEEGVQSVRHVGGAEQP